jgi:hypothetical protein
MPSILRARRPVRDVVDLPNRPADRFERLSLQHNGTLSKAKRQSPDYPMLSDREIAGLGNAVVERFDFKAEE